jgi:hypothetical protein
MPFAPRSRVHQDGLKEELSKVSSQLHSDFVCTTSK